MDVVKLSRQVAAYFVRKLPSSRHLFEELAQEAAIAILAVAPRYRPGALSIESYVKPYALKACQKHCAGFSGPVNRAHLPNDYHGSRAVWLGSIQEQASGESPEDTVDRQRADAIAKELCEQRSKSFRNPQRAKEILHASLTQSTTAVGVQYGISRQRVEQIIAKGFGSTVGSP